MQKQKNLNFKRYENKVETNWYKFYNNVSKHLEYPDISLYEMLENNSSTRLGLTAYNYFGRKAEVSKSTLSKLLNHKYGKIGISGTLLGLIAKGMGMTLPELEEKIIEYQIAYQNGKMQQKTYTDKDKLVARISEEIKRLDVEELKILHSIVLEVDKKTLKSLDIIVKNMKNME